MHHSKVKYKTVMGWEGRAEYRVTFTAVTMDQIFEKEPYKSAAFTRDCLSHQNLRSITESSDDDFPKAFKHILHHNYAIKILNIIQ